jgi:hypothetical protein
MLTVQQGQGLASIFCIHSGIMGSLVLVHPGIFLKKIMNPSRPERRPLLRLRYIVISSS